MVSLLAYILGGRLIRRMNDEEKRREMDVLRMARSGEGRDSISVEKLAISDTYTVGVDMQKALANPGSDYDIVLREGDMIYIPEYINTVKISGSVMYPNTVNWEKGKKGNTMLIWLVAMVIMQRRGRHMLSI